MFPKEPRTRLTITSTPKEEVDDAAAGAVVDYGGCTGAGEWQGLDPIVPEPGTYVNLARVWKAGDKVELEMPMRLTREKLSDDTTMQAFLYGPVVLAGQFPMGELSFRLLHGEEDPKVKESPIPVPVLAEKSAKLTEWIVPVDEKAMVFKATGTSGEQVTLKPLNESWQRFAVYFKVV